MRRKLLVIFLGISLLITACGGNTSSSVQSNSEDNGANALGASSTESESEEIESQDSSAESKTIEIEDIVWTVDEGIVDGERYVLLDYSNNSELIIAGLELAFSEKENLTEEEKDSFYQNLVEQFDFSEEDVEELKTRAISASAETEAAVLPGESINNIHVNYYSGYYYVRDINHYNMLEPDIATIRFVVDDKIYTEYYDFNSGKYTVEDETEEASYWSSTTLGEKAPKPEAPIIKAGGRDDEVCFMFEAYGFSLEKFNEYAQKCKDLGYINDSAEHDGFYRGYDSDGYEVYLFYEEDSRSMHATISAPDGEPSEDEDSETDTSQEVPSEASAEAVSDDEIRADFKDFVDSYEEYMDEYVDFMKEYNESDDALSMLDDYSTMMDKYIEFSAKAAEYESGDLSNAETAYLLDAENRINKKLLEIGE